MYLHIHYRTSPPPQPLGSALFHVVITRLVYIVGIIICYQNLMWVRARVCVHTCAPTIAIILNNRVYHPKQDDLFYSPPKVVSVSFCEFYVTVWMMMMNGVLRPLLCTHWAKRAERHPKVVKRIQRWNNLQIFPRRDSNTGGSDLWSNTLPLDHGGAPVCWMLSPLNREWASVHWWKSRLRVKARNFKLAE